MDQKLPDNGLHYLLIINNDNQPLFFKSYKSSTDDLNIQLHCYACLDFLDEKWVLKCCQFLGPVYTIYNLSGQYLIYAFYTVTKIKILAILKQKPIQIIFPQILQVIQALAVSTISECTRLKQIWQKISLSTGFIGLNSQFQMSNFQKVTKTDTISIVFPYLIILIFSCIIFYLHQFFAYHYSYNPKYQLIK